MRMKMNEDITTKERILRLAKVLKVTPIPEKVGLEKDRGKWWLVGCAEGDTVLPQTSNLHTINEALNAVEAWLAFEVDSLKKTND